MRLYVFRHGPAGERDAKRWPDDSLRPLSRAGRSRAAAAVRGIRAACKPLPAVILTSPLLRAHQTALLAQSGLRLPPRALKNCEALQPGRPVQALLDALAEHGEQPVMIVGHEPDLSRLVAHLACGQPGGVALELKKAGLCVLDVQWQPQPQATLLALLRPAVLRALGR
ncbi:MAG: histidine phosphatase family protein [Planctomycetes bacterium]|nr:histidine phosphatase family protein [Planctomycetota bacterium]